MTLNSRSAAAAYVVAVTLASVAALEAGKAVAACGYAVCADIGRTNQQFSDGTTFYFGNNGSTECLKYLESETKKSAKGCYSPSGTTTVNKYFYGTPDCTEPLGVWVTASGVNGLDDYVGIGCCGSCG